MLKPTINELYTHNEEEKSYNRTIKAVSPISMNIMVPKSEDEKYSILTRITWLCKDIHNKLFCLTTTYVAENELDEEFFLTSPLLSDKHYINQNLTADILMSSLDHFITDMNFNIISKDNRINIHKIKSFQIYCHAFDKTDDGEKIYKIMASPEVFSTLTFADEYMTNGILNNADLYSALSFGANENNNTIIFDVDTYDIVSIAPLKSTGCSYRNLAVKVRLHHKEDIYNEKSSEEKADYVDEYPYIELLMLIQLPKSSKIKATRVKKNKLEDLLEGMNDRNQFIQKFSFDHVINCDTPYKFIRASNKYNDGILITFDSSRFEFLEHDVKEYLVFGLLSITEIPMPKKSKKSK